MMSVTYGVSEERGLRSTMEDVHAFWADEEDGFFSAEVYDGHGGVDAARIASSVITPYFMEARKKEREKPAAQRCVESELLYKAYLEADRAIIAAGAEGGTTAAHFYISGGRIIVANVGDTRVIMGKRWGVSILTVDHKPDLPEEKRRIEAEGGVVLFHGIPRVQGMLAMSRSLGDVHLKPFIIPTPRIVEFNPGKENDYVVVACDGIWDVLKPKTVMKIVRSTKDPESAAMKISRRALDEGSTDNITVVVVDLRQYTADLARKTMEMVSAIDYSKLPFGRAI